MHWSRSMALPPRAQPVPSWWLTPASRLGRVAICCLILENFLLLFAPLAFLLGGSPGMGFSPRASVLVAFSDAGFLLSLADLFAVIGFSILAPVLFLLLIRLVKSKRRVPFDTLLLGRALARVVAVLPLKLYAQARPAAPRPRPRRPGAPGPPGRVPLRGWGADRGGGGPPRGRPPGGAGGPRPPAGLRLGAGFRRRSASPTAALPGEHDAVRPAAAHGLTRVSAEGPETDSGSTGYCRASGPHHRPQPQLCSFAPPWFAPAYSPSQAPVCPLCGPGASKRCHVRIRKYLGACNGNRDCNLHLRLRARAHGTRRHRLRRHRLLDGNVQWTGLRCVDPYTVGRGHDGRRHRRPPARRRGHRRDVRPSRHSGR